jgi:hypothetical protein
MWTTEPHWGCGIMGVVGVVRWRERDGEIMIDPIERLNFIQKSLKSFGWI